MASYSDETRAKAVALLEANGYPNDKGALQHTANVMEIPHTTIRRWYLKLSNPPPNGIVQEKKREIRELLDEALQKIMPVIIGKIEDSDEMGKTSLQQAVTSLGILIDKKRVLDGQPTERIVISVHEAYESAADEFDRLIFSAAKRGDAEQVSGNTNDRTEGGAEI